MDLSSVLNHDNKITEIFQISYQTKTTPSVNNPDNPNNPNKSSKNGLKINSNSPNNPKKSNISTTGDNTNDSGDGSTTTGGIGEWMKEPWNQCGIGAILASAIGACYSLDRGRYISQGYYGY